MSELVTDEQVADFRRDGAVVGGIVAAGDVATLVRGVERNLAANAPRPHRTSPPFEELDGALPAGAPLDHPLFPVVWQA
jgi:hypothetical protein